MSNEVAALITGQSPQELAPIVRQVLTDTAVAIGKVQMTKIGRSAGTATAGIYRVTGWAETKDSKLGNAHAMDITREESFNDKDN